MKTSCLANPLNWIVFRGEGFQGHVVKNNWAALSQGSPIALV